MKNDNHIPGSCKHATCTFMQAMSRKALYALTLVMIMNISMASGQKLNLNYKVVNNGNTVGWVKIQKLDNATGSSIVLTSQVKKRVIFLLTVDEKQDAYFNETGMINSSIYRKVNDNVKVNQQTIFKGNYYEVNNPQTSQRVVIQQVQYNLLSMYIKEPVNITKVYSEAFQRYLVIEPQGNSVYKLKQPDGNVNYYHYENGICSKVVMEHSLFTIAFVRI